MNYCIFSASLKPIMPKSGARMHWSCLVFLSNAVLGLPDSSTKSESVIYTYDIAYIDLSAVSYPAYMRNRYDFISKANSSKFSSLPWNSFGGVHWHGPIASINHWWTSWRTCGSKCGSHLLLKTSAKIFWFFWASSRSCESMNELRYHGKLRKLSSTNNYV